MRGLKREGEISGGDRIQVHMYVHNKLNSLSVGVLKREGERSGGDIYNVHVQERIIIDPLQSEALT